jgi:hypothetical protein
LRRRYVIAPMPANPRIIIAQVEGSGDCRNASHNLMSFPITDGFHQLIGPKPEGVKGNSWFVFSTTNGFRPFSGFSNAKKTLDAEIAPRGLSDFGRPV